MAARKSKAAKVESTPQTDPRAPLAFDAFLAAAQKALRVLADDLLRRADDSPAVTAALTARWTSEKDAGRTADVYEVYRRRVVGQVAAAWLLSMVFVRTLEDRGLVERNRIAGPGASDAQKQFFDLAPFLTERDYLLTMFRELSNLEGAKDLFDPKHDLLWRLAPSADGARMLLELFRAPNPDTPTFRFGQSDTRFLGDLYQLLDEDVRERFALLQTPRFVESFILDRTLERSVQEFGVDATTVIDPTCGSGHFLLGAFERLFDHQLRNNPSLDPRKAVEKALDAVHGVDLNPYAVSIARFRLTLAGLEKGAWTKIEAAPRLPLNLVVADSLLHRVLAGQATFADVAGQSGKTWKGEQFALEDEAEAKRVLGKRYAVVVGNPPYITVKDAALRETYRGLYPRSAAGKYSLGAPFTERFFDLARERGFVGMITANSFMKREFGKRLIEDYLRSVNLELIVNSSGAYIPGHGTPTVLLCGRNERPAGGKVLAVLAKRGEPTTPQVPEQGLVWRSIADHFAEVGFENDFVSVAQLERATLEMHPWSLGGGGATELKDTLEERAAVRLRDRATIGVGGMSNADDVYIAIRGDWERLNMPPDLVRPLVIGEYLRDWSNSSPLTVYFPYNAQYRLVPPAGRAMQLLWPYRTTLAARAVFGGGTYRTAGRPWWEWHQVTTDRYRTPLSITFAFVATHNHFVLDRGGKVFKQSAPIIKLPETATEDDHLALLGYLNSSTACFWMKQVFSPKGMQNGSKANATPFLVRFEFDGTKLRSLPLPPGLLGTKRAEYVRLGRELDALATRRSGLNFATILASTDAAGLNLERTVDETILAREDCLAKEIALQEELDWLVYQDFGLADARPRSAVTGLSRLENGQRPFEAVLAQTDEASVREGWFRWNETEPAANVPPYLTQGERAVWQYRCESIRATPLLGLLESPEAKRRWVQPSGKAAQELQRDEKTLKDEAEAWLEDRFEDAIRGRTAAVTLDELAKSCGGVEKLAAVASWLGYPSLKEAFSACLRERSVPCCAGLRYSPSGLEKRTAWENVWRQQRQEDAGGPAPATPPPAYEPNDYAQPSFARLRGKLDVPKERFISYPGCESDEDGSPVYGWAGWDHLQQAQALAGLYQKRKTEEGWGKERLVPMLAGLDELVPWVIQWHNEPDESFGGLRLGDYFRDFVAGECQALGLTLEDVRAWRPAPRKGRGRIAKAAADAEPADD